MTPTIEIPANLVDRMRELGTFSVELACEALAERNGSAADVRTAIAVDDQLRTDGLVRISADDCVRLISDELDRDSSAGRHDGVTTIEEHDALIAYLTVNRALVELRDQAAQLLGVAVVA